MRRALGPVCAGIAGCVLLLPATVIAETTWDCRATADGRGWRCSGDGEALDVPTGVAPGAADAPTDKEPAMPPDTALPPPPSPAPSPQSSAPPVSSTSPRPAPDGPRTPTSDIRATAGSGGANDAAVATTGRAAVSARPTGAAHGVTTAATVARTATPTQETMPPESPDTAVDSPDDNGSPGHSASSAAAAPSVAGTRPQPSAGPADTQIDQGIDWDRLCDTGASRLSRAVAADPGEPGDHPLTIDADSLVTELAPERAVFSGNVELSHGAVTLQADELTLNRGTGDIDARGGFLLSRPDVRISGASAHYQLASGRGEVEQASYRVPPIGARGDAESAAFVGGGRSRYRNISYTTCRPGMSDWLLRAQALELDHTEGLGTAEDASLRFLGVPILYAPTFTFPIDDRRRSGVLIPSVGYSSNTGVDVSVPYYLNLAENYDLTLTPRLMSERGLMLGGEFRFLTETTGGTLAGEYLPDDREYDGSNSQRGSASLFSHTQFNPRTEAAVRLGYVSDNDYLQDLGKSLAVTSTTHIERAGELRFHGDSYELLGRVQGYQTVDDAIANADRPYSRLPQLLFDLSNPTGPAGTAYHLSAEYVNFYRKDSVRGHRVDLYPALSLPLRQDWGYVEPKVGARYTAYQLDDQASGLDDSPAHGSGVFSLDSGLFFDRQANWFGTAVNHTLEPRLYYLLVPASDQSDQPVFDTAVLDVSYDNLFRENRFSGPDRLGDANQVTLGLSSRMIAGDSGEELLRTSIGQILYFDDRDVTLPGEPAAKDSSSAVVGELAARLGGGWRTRAGLQWDPHDGSEGTIDQALAQISYRDHERRVFNAAYRLRDGVVKQTDLAAIWPLSEKVSLIGRHNYSLRDNRLLEALAGIEYGRCCWRVRALVRSYTDGADDDRNVALLVQLELNGLGQLGNDIDKTLERGIYGYRTDDDEYN